MAGGGAVGGVGGGGGTAGGVAAMGNIGIGAASASMSAKAKATPASPPASSVVHISAGARAAHAHSASHGGNGGVRNLGKLLDGLRADVLLALLEKRHHKNHAEGIAIDALASAAMAVKAYQNMSPAGGSPSMASVQSVGASAGFSARA